MKEKVTKIIKNVVHTRSQSLEGKFDCMLVMFEEQREDFKAFGQELVGFGKRFDHLETRVDATFEEVGRMSVSLTSVEADVKEIKTDIVVIKSDIVEIKTDIVVMKADIVEMKSDIVEIKTDIVEIKTDIVEIKADIAEVKTDVKIVKTRLVQKADTKRVEILETRMEAY